MQWSKSVGICLGATTMSIVEIEKKDCPAGFVVTNVISKEHEGDPKGVLKKYLDEYDLNEKYLAVTGRKFREFINISSITEPEAVELAYNFLRNETNEDYDAVVSAGGETFMVYQMDKKGKISRVSAGNKCASGTGEFFMQQIRRMNVSVDEAIRLAQTSEKPHQLSGRCSVFCKSDCTHALNKGESIADVAAGLAKMIANKIHALVVKLNAQKIMVVGGTARNGAVIKYVKELVNQVDVPKEAPYFEALGAAIWAFNNNQTEHPEKGCYFKDKVSSFTFQKPLKDFVNMVDFKEMPRETAKNGDKCIIGLDVGSTTTKAVLFRVDDEKIVGSIYLRTNGSPVEASRNCYKALLDGLNGIKVEIIGVGVTGSGRYIAGLHADTDGIINEIIAHARAAAHFDSEVDTIFEIGGQDAKYTYITNSVASDYAMNEACSAGTGSFLEESAKESLGIEMEDIADIALNSTNPPNFSDQCAAFISSDINSAFQEGISREDIIAGLVYSICINYVNRVKGARQVGKKVFMQGGVCYNKAVPIAMAAITGKKIIVPPEPGLMGAYGVALEVENMLEIGLLQPKQFDLKELADRTVEYGQSFRCQDPKCDRRCEINMIHVCGQKIPFGGACNKYYNARRNVSYDVEKLNHIAYRRHLIFNKYMQPRADLPENAITVGLNKAFHVNTLAPMYFAFFNELGCKVVMSSEVHQSAIDKGTTSFCLSSQIALGLFEDLLRKKPDYIFMPQIMEMHVSEQKEYRKEFQTVCMFVQGEPFFQKATFLKDKPENEKPVMLTPALNFMRGFDTQEDVFVKVATQMGFTAEQGKKAYAKAFQAQQAFFKDMKDEGKKIIDEIHADSNRTAVVLFGRPYNAFALEANKGVPFKFASRGVEIIPYDFLPYELEENYKGTYWEMGQRIIKAARIVKRDPQLFGCYLTNFLCALDSMMVPHFRDLMGTKPSLTIEVDSHTADAGVNTRIEAFMDVVKNYIKVREKIHDEKSDFRRAVTEIDGAGKPWFIDSDGQKHSIVGEKIRVLIPSMGDMFNKGVAACLRHAGWNAEALPVCDREALDLGRSVTTSKECLPIINIIGELLKHLKYRKDPNEKTVLFMVSAGGCCRVGQYIILLNTVIDKLKIKNLAIISLANDNGYAGLGIGFRLDMAKIMYVADVFDDMRSAIKAMAVNRDEGMEILNEEYDRLLGAIDRTNKNSFYKQLNLSAMRLASVKLKRPISEAKYVGVVGEIFVRRDHFSLMDIPGKLADNGFVMLDAHVMEWNRYVDYLKETHMFEMRTTLLGKIETAVSDWIQDYHEKKIKTILENTGLYEKEMVNIRKCIAHSTHFFPYTLTGEPGLSSGSALYHLINRWCGVINIGPFGCMNSRMTEAVTTAHMTLDGKQRSEEEAGEFIDLSAYRDDVDMLPFLSVESDGNPFSQILTAKFETFMLQANRLHGLMMKNRK